MGTKRDQQFQREIKPLVLQILQITRSDTMDCVEPAVGIEPTTGGLRIRGLFFPPDLKLKPLGYGLNDLQFFAHRGAKSKKLYNNS